jgi:hypothetical protein
MAVVSPENRRLADQLRELADQIENDNFLGFAYVLCETRDSDDSDDSDDHRQFKAGATVHETVVDASTVILQMSECLKALAEEESSE